MKNKIGTKRKKKIKEKLLKIDSKCAYCGKELTVETCTLDHIIPVSKFNGSPGDQTNLVLACLFCNNAKDDTIIKNYCCPSHGGLK